MEYLVTMTTHVPEGTRSEMVDDIRAREAAHARELAAHGHVLLESLLAVPVTENADHAVDAAPERPRDL